MTIQQQVDAAVKAVCPIHGISFGLPADKATWRIDFDDAATPEQRQAALGVVAAFDVQAELAAIAALEARKSVDRTEEDQTKLDAQIQSDLNMTPTEVNSTVDTVFSGFTAPQRAFLKRLVRMVLAAARRVLR